ncbi:MAG: YraN family protein [Candidatus Schekmanbacteria bacterium]|nr:YraN family protein [Candidatus Schekmanbacteria bacterium]
MQSRSDWGRQAEGEAAAFLETRGFRIVARNYRIRGVGEVDLVALEGGALVFVEVRSRRGRNVGELVAAALESVTPRKQARLARIASAYLAERPPPAASDGSCRFDVIAVALGADGRRTFELVRDAFCLGD